MLITKGQWEGLGEIGIILLPPPPHPGPFVLLFIFFDCEIFLIVLLYAVKLSVLGRESELVTKKA
jgi:hypothetical protein